MLFKRTREWARSLRGPDKAERLRQWILGPDKALSAALQSNQFQYRPGMGEQDQSKTDRAGQVRWQTVLRGQRRLNPPTSGKVVDMAGRR